MCKKYFVEMVRCGVGEETGPAVVPVNVSVKFNCGGESKWLTNSELAGIPNFYLTNKDIFDKFMKNDFEDDDEIENSFIDEFAGIKLGADYDEIEKELVRKQDNPACKLIGYIIKLTQCDMDDVEPLIKAIEGKYIDEI